MFGNPDLKMDSLPLRILPRLREKFATVEFETVDPNEEWEVPEDLVIIDTVLGIKEPGIFVDLKSFRPAPSLSLHDFDAYANLRWLQKLGKISRVTIYGLPVDVTEDEAVEFINESLRLSYKK